MDSNPQKYPDNSDFCVMIRFQVSFSQGGDLHSDRPNELCMSNPNFSPHVDSILAFPV